MGPSCPARQDGGNDDAGPATEAPETQVSSVGSLTLSRNAGLGCARLQRLTHDRRQHR